jgi:hypothetical protein
MPDEMSDDEVLVVVVCAAASLFGFLRWYIPLFRVTTLGGSIFQRLVLIATPIVNLGVLYFVLHHWASHEVKQDFRYIGLFMLAGAFWMFLAVEALLPVFGISVRDDAIEGRNSAALITTCGWLTGIMLCYAGGNIGEGPTIWTTLIPAAWAAMALGIIWVIMDAVAPISDEIVLGTGPRGGMPDGSIPRRERRNPWPRSCRGFRLVQSDAVRCTA